MITRGKVVRTVRDTGNQVVGNMVVGDVVQEEATDPAEKRTIDGGDGTTDKGPAVLAEMGHRRIGVVEIGKHHDPVVRKQVRDRVVFDDRGERGQGDPVPDSTGHEGQGDIGDHDLPELLLLEQG